VARSPRQFLGAQAARSTVSLARLALFRLRLQLVGDMFFNLGPVAVQCRYKLAILRDRPVLARPACALRIFPDVFGAVLELREEIAPLGIDRIRIAFV